MNANEPSMKCRENAQSVKTTGLLTLGDQSAAGNLLYWLHGRRHKEGMISIQG